MFEESISDLAYGLALGVAAVAVLASLVAAGVVFWGGDDPLLGTGLVMTALFNGGLLMLLRRRKKSTAESESSS